MGSRFVKIFVLLGALPAPFYFYFFLLKLDQCQKLVDQLSAFPEYSRSRK